MSGHPFQKLCFDVFQTILSFLPPIPYLFQLQRVSSTWQELCKECMQEECSELHWDDTFIYSYDRKMINHEEESQNSGGMTVLYKLMEKCFKTKQGSDWFLFFRKVLKNFRKLDKLILKNMDINDAVFFLLIAEWGGSVRNLSFVNCSFKLSCEMFPRSSATPSDCEFILENCLWKDSEGIQCFKKGIENCAIEQVSQAHFNIKISDNEYKVTFFCILRCFTKLKKVISFNTTSDAFDTISISERLRKIKEETECYHKCLSNIEFELDSYSRACVLLDETKDLDLVLKFHFEELISKYNLRKNRLEQYRLEYLTDNDKIALFHQNLKSIYYFLHHYSYLSLETKSTDMRGRNILNHALAQTEIPTVEFLIHYLAFGDEKSVTLE